MGFQVAAAAIDLDKAPPFIEMVLLPILFDLAAALCDT
jgi:hypothetical protein